jgi:hypothetical protein
MAVDLESSKTFQQLMIELGEPFGLIEYGTAGDEAAQLPTDAETLRKLKTCVNNAYKLFLRADPNWSFLILPHVITTNSDGLGPDNLEGDAARYRLPSPIRTKPQTNLVFLGTSGQGEVQTWTPRLIRNRQQAQEGSGMPQLAGFRRVETSDGIDTAKIAWEVIFWPTPDGVYELEGEFRVLPYDLVDLGERHVAGADHDYAILAAAKWLWVKDDSSEQATLATYAADWAQALADSRTLDKRLRPVRERQLRDPSVDRPSARGIPRGLVTTIDGTPIP